MDALPPSLLFLYTWYGISKDFAGVLVTLLIFTSRPPLLPPPNFQNKKYPKLDVDLYTKLINPKVIHYHVLRTNLCSGCRRLCFLGHHIVSQLLEKFPSAQISVLDLRTTHNRFPLVIYYDGDITSIAGVQRVLDQVRPQVIIHTASPVVADFKGSSTLYHKVNVDGIRVLLECAGQIGCTSSASVVHDSVNDLVNVDESLPVLRYPKQTEIYSHIKGLAVLSSNRKQSGMLTVAIRPAGIFGEGDVQMLPNILNVYYTGKTKIQLGDNRNWFDFSYVSNAAYAHILAAKK